jgi:hypothetical protein
LTSQWLFGLEAGTGRPGQRTSRKNPRSPFQWFTCRMLSQYSRAEEAPVPGSQYSITLSSSSSRVSTFSGWPSQSVQAQNCRHRLAHLPASTPSGHTGPNTRQVLQCTFAASSSRFRDRPRPVRPDLGQGWAWPAVAAARTRRLVECGRTRQRGLSRRATPAGAANSPRTWWPDRAGAAGVRAPACRGTREPARRTTSPARGP